MIKIKKISKKPLFILSAIILIVLLSGGYYLFDKRQNKESKAATQAPSQQEEKINLDSPTEQDKLAAEQNKQSIAERDQQVQKQPSASGKKSVKPVITYAGQYGPQVEVGGYVPGVYEDTGTCTARFTNGSQTFTKSVKAIKNVSSTDCPAMVANNTEFSPKGKWSVVVSYDSPAANGASDSKAIEVR
jgi:hypothetical protein